ncbi:hypothetical protein F5B22DRAFT_651537 [Xylaria bambusicola]|uniref:uncharacterized protein n=1 Tax=Xylaria bambusicola TaxID=326684 RepID=UPI0020072E9F|nr:uncharacterized protein F5B22DRAFT_651537 [Xylaria bambusicola]KAI0505603.1 hypothetical protein F5B22DRAFT_651537 [Xylaria bambusicola]
MRCAVFPALVGLVVVRGQIIGRQMATSTVTAYAHPMTFWPLAHLAPAATPLTYDDPPTASRVRPNNMPREEDVDASIHGYGSWAPLSPSSSSSSPSSSLSVSTALTSPSLPTATTTCSLIKGSYPTSTLPAFCRPTLFANAPSLLASDPPRSTAVVTMGANSVQDKVSCCAYCAAYYNCYAWRFVPSYVGTPSERLPGGFDPWKHGNCEIAYHVGTNDGDGEGEGEGVTRKGAPDICPNGRLKDVINGTMNAGNDTWMNGLYYNGWNQGACADLGGVVFETGRDPGVGDGSGVCHE